MRKHVFFFHHLKEWRRLKPFLFFPVQLTSPMFNNEAPCLMSHIRTHSCPFLDIENHILKHALIYCYFSFRLLRRLLRKVRPSKIFKFPHPTQTTIKRRRRWTKKRRTKSHGTSEERKEKKKAYFEEIPLLLRTYVYYSHVLSSILFRPAVKIDWCLYYTCLIDCVTLTN